METLGLRRSYRETEVWYWERPAIGDGAAPVAVETPSYYSCLVSSSWRMTTQYISSCGVEPAEPMRWVVHTAEGRTRVDLLKPFGARKVVSPRCWTLSLGFDNTPGCWFCFALPVAALVLPSENRNAWKVVFNLQKPTVKRFGALQEIWDIYRMKSTKTMEIVKLCHALYCDVNMRSLGWTRKIMIIFLTLGTAGPHTCWASTAPLTDTPTLHTAPLTDIRPSALYHWLTPHHPSTAH